MFPFESAILFAILSVRLYHKTIIMYAYVCKIWLQMEQFPNNKNRNDQVEN